MKRREREREGNRRGEKKDTVEDAKRRRDALGWVVNVSGGADEFGRVKLNQRRIQCTNADLAFCVGGIVEFLGMSS